MTLVAAIAPPPHPGGTVKRGVSIGVAAALAVAAWVLPVRSQDRAGELIKQSTEAVKKLKSLQADVEVRNGAQVKRGTLAFKRPNFARIDMKTAGAFIVSDGKSVFNYIPAANQYQKAKADPAGANIQDVWALAFFQPEKLIQMVGGTPAVAGTEKIDGAEHDVLEVVPTPGAKIRLFIARDTSLLVRLDQVSGEGDQAQTETMILKNVRPNAMLADALFKWTPPKTAKAYEAPDFEKSLIAVGKKAPDFDLSKPGGGRLALSSTLKGKKATLVNFWFYG
jgi:outer membrane lipoprotein-sorting protein